MVRRRNIFPRRVLWLAPLLILVSACSTPSFSGLPQYASNDPSNVIASADAVVVSPSLLSFRDLDGDGRAGPGDLLLFAVVVQNTSKARVVISEVALTAKEIAAQCPGTPDIDIGSSTICTAADPISAQEAASGQAQAGFSAQWETLSNGSSQISEGSTISIPLSSLTLPTPPATPTPEPTPAPAANPKITAKPTPASGTSTITAAYFGPEVNLVWYEIYGATPTEIDNSIAQRGPATNGGQVEAEALTQESIHYQFKFQTNTSGNCQIVATDSPAVDIAITVIIPHWNRPAGASDTTAAWVAQDLTRVVVHEKVHVGNAIAAETDANQVLTASTCANAETNLDKVWTQLKTKDCQFDMDQYGKAQGLTLASCVAGQW